MNAIERYIASRPPRCKGRAQALHALVLSLYPSMETNMKYKMPTYTLGDNWFAFGHQKSHFSVYTCSADKIAIFKRKHPEIRSGCLNFWDNDDFPIVDLKSIIRAALKNKLYSRRSA
jgi:uncharacterized protein YdhG (YjbR/CyaY superfamily)